MQKTSYICVVVQTRKSVISCQVNIGAVVFVCTITVIRSAPNYYSRHWHTIITVRCPTGAGVDVPDMVITPGHYLERYLVDYEEVALPDGNNLAGKYRLYAKEGTDPLSYISPKLIAFIVKHDDFYLEVRKGVMLAFRKDHALANADDVALLFSLAETFNHSCVELIKE